MQVMYICMLYTLSVEPSEQSVQWMSSLYTMYVVEYMKANFKLHEMNDPWLLL